MKKSWRPAVREASPPTQPHAQASADPVLPPPGAQSRKPSECPPPGGAPSKASRARGHWWLSPGRAEPRPPRRGSARWEGACAACAEGSDQADGSLRSETKVKIEKAAPSFFAPNLRCLPRKTTTSERSPIARQDARRSAYGKRCWCGLSPTARPDSIVGVVSRVAKPRSKGARRAEYSGASKHQTPQFEAFGGTACKRSRIESFATHALMPSLALPFGR